MDHQDEHFAKKMQASILEEKQKYVKFLYLSPFISCYTFFY